MGFKATFALLILSVFTGSALANPCFEEGLDPFVPSYRMPSGKHAGKCLETHKRSYRIVTEEEARQIIPEKAIRPNTQFIANLSHAGDFWVAGFPKADGIENISFLVERFKPRWLAAHTMIRVDFKEPILLYSQSSKMTPPLPLKSFILTVEALAMKDGPQFGVISTLQDNFALVKRIQSTDDRIAMAITDEKNPVNQYRINLGQHGNDDLWKSLLNQLHDPLMTERYHLLGRNCMNVLFAAFDHFFHRTRNWISKIATFYPTVASSALNRRGLLDKKIPTLNEEIESISEETKALVCPSYVKQTNPSDLDELPQIVKTLSQ